jgi:hypothetical protein
MVSRRHYLLLHIFGLFPSVSTVHKFDPVGLLPLSTGGSLVVMVSVPDLWIVTPSFPS